MNITSECEKSVPSEFISQDSQNLRGMIEELAQINSSDLKELGLKDKVIEFDKSFAREHILETLQELLPWDEMVSKNQEVTLPNQFVYSLPANSENFILSEGVAKQLGGEEVVPSPQVMPLASVTVPSENTGIHRKKAGRGHLVTRSNIEIEVS
ncbi:15062_t:CDS:2 [Racocetra persica]|uniref:15062_t:CDS:1 n=1 Tax=Racocetra persica TaxID=160502 RepID=A0ACA9KLY7_9GLOM|nr:15062_t:CDS:2 [Racocetra persica]